MAILDELREIVAEEAPGYELVLVSPVDTEEKGGETAPDYGAPVDATLNIEAVKASPAEADRDIGGDADDVIGAGRLTPGGVPVLLRPASVQGADPHSKLISATVSLADRKVTFWQG